MRKSIRNWVWKTFKKTFLTKSTIICFYVCNFSININQILRWPRELNALQIEKNTCKLRKQLHQFDNTCAANTHNTTKQRNALQIQFFIWLCCEHLQHLLSNWWRCFLDLLVLFLFAARWALSATVVYLQKQWLHKHFINLEIKSITFMNFHLNLY